MNLGDAKEVLATSPDVRLRLRAFGVLVRETHLLEQADLEELTAIGGELPDAFRSVFPQGLDAVICACTIAAGDTDESTEDLWLGVLQCSSSE
jgi:hypothetical protein